MHYFVQFFSTPHSFFQEPWPDAPPAAPALAAGEGPQSLRHGGKEAAEPGKNRTGGKSAHGAGKTLLLKKAGTTSQAAEPLTCTGKTQGSGKAAEPLLTQAQHQKESEEKKNGSRTLKSCAALGQATFHRAFQQKAKRATGGPQRNLLPASVSSPSCIIFFSPVYFFIISFAKLKTSLHQDISIRLRAPLGTALTHRGQKVWELKKK